jgi:hypothetical protein
MKKYFAIFLLLILSDFLKSQDIKSLFLPSPVVEMVQDAVKDGILIVRQEYRLQDVATKQFFGRNNREFFGATYSLAFKLNGDYCGGQKITEPWSADKHYKEFENDEKYIPVISKTLYRKTDNKSFETLAYDTSSIVTVVPEYIYTWQDSTGDFGFQVDKTSGIKKGWLVWVTTPQDIQQQDTANVRLESYRTEIEVKKDSVFYEIKEPRTTDFIIGGFYVLPKVTKIGQITFHLVGILQPVDDKWTVVTFGAAAGTIEDNKSLLTPVVTNNKSATDE